MGIRLEQKRAGGVDRAIGKGGKVANCTECKLDSAGNHASNCPFYRHPGQQSPYTLYGWVCPKCGRGNAPACMTCPCVPTDVLERTIDAAERYAANYDGDERSDIKTDVLNAFYAGTKFGQIGRKNEKQSD